ncbi:MAG TPA: hypothetical protein VEZ46_08650 [Mycobacteriales bacterium]|jgi:hypothetical protein|nr:hypothetical protein [Mycobacteriales bacterium]
MNDIEDLVRRTLTDPRRELVADPRHAATYRSGAARLHGRRTAMGVAAVAAAVVGAGGVGVALSSPDRANDSPAATATSAAPTASPTPPAIRTEPMRELSEVVDAVLFRGTLLWTLTKEGTVQHTYLGSPSRVTTSTAAVRRTPTGIVAGDDSVWAWGANGTASASLTEFATSTLEARRSLELPAYLYSAAVLDGELWLASDKGLYRLKAGATTPELLPGRQPTAVVADEARRRLLLAEDPYVVAYDPTTGEETARVDIGLGKISIALTGDGQLWAAGYGNEADADRDKVVHLDATSLAVVGGTPMNDRIGPGAVVWPGDSVLWVENNGGNVTCVDATTGALASAPLQGNNETGSVDGFGYQVEFGVRRLVLPPGCPG